MATSVDAQATLLDGETVPSADLRRQIYGGIYPTAGIVSGLNAQSTPTPSMKVRLPAGLCLVDDGTGGFVPMYLLTQTDLDITASSATLPRVDSVIAEVVDTGDGATLIRRFRVITGTPASSPVAPTLPPTDQPTALTLRLANVFVQANAETNGNVRAQDVSVEAVPAHVSLRPVSSKMASKPTSGSSAVYNDFTTGQWPAVTLTVPSSGAIIVTIGIGLLASEVSSVSTIRISYRISGSDTLGAGPNDSKCVLATGGDEISASRTTHITGLTPGGVITVTPQWRTSSGDVEDTNFSDGQLIVQPIP